MGLLAATPPAMEVLFELLLPESLFGFSEEQDKSPGTAALIAAKVAALDVSELPLGPPLTFVPLAFFCSPMRAKAARAASSLPARK